MHHFHQRLHFRHLNKWTQVLQGTVLRERWCYILSTDQHLFYLVGIRYMSNYSSYQFALQARLLQHPMCCHTHYLWGIHSFPLSLPTAAYLIVADTKFQHLKALNPPSPTPLSLLKPSLPTIGSPLGCIYRRILWEPSPCSGSGGGSGGEGGASRGVGMGDWGP